MPSPSSESFAREFARLDKRLRALETARTRFANVSLNGAHLPIYDENGNLRQLIGLQPDGSYAVVNQNGPPPPVPADPEASAWPGAAVVSWGGGTATGGVWPADFSHIEVHVSTSPGFTPSNSTQLSYFTSPRGGAVTLALPPILHYVRLVAVSLSGVESTPSGEVEVTPLVAAPDATDGEAPGSSPTPELTGLPRTIIAKWDGVTNNDAVTYEVHVSTVAGFTPNAATLYADTPATMVVIDQVPPGGRLNYDTTYHVRIVAKDADGAAQASTTAAVTLDPNATADIAVGSITAALLESVLVLSSTIKTAETGRRVELSNTGLTLFDQANNPLVLFPTDNNLAAYIKGSAELGELTVLGNMAIRGTTNELSKGSVLTLAGKITSPKAAPTVSLSWPNVETWFTDDPNTYERVGLALNDNGLYGTVNRFFGGQLYLFSQTGAFWGNAPVPDPAGWSNFDPIGGVTFLGGDWYFLGTARRNADGKVYRQFRRCTLTGGSLVLNQHTDVALGEFTDTDDPPAWECIGNDGTTIITAAYNSAGVLRLRTYDPVFLGLQSNVSLGGSPTGIRRRVAYVGRGSFDFGGDRVVVAHRTAGAADRKVWVWNGTTLARSTNDDFTKVGGTTVGLVWAPESGVVSFRGLDSNAIFHTYSAINWTNQSNQWWASFTWYDGDAGGTGTHETGESPRAMFTMEKRATVMFSCPPAPDLGGPDDPDRARFYLGRGTNPPATGGMFLTATPGAGVTTVSLTSVSFTGANPLPQPGTFPDDAYAEVRDAAGNLLFDGLGRTPWAPVGAMFLWPTTTAPAGWVLANGAARSRGDALWGVIGTTFGAPTGTEYNLPNPPAPDASTRWIIKV